MSSHRQGRVTIAVYHVETNPTFTEETNMNSRHRQSHLTPADTLTGHALAQHMARYSHRPWIAWTDKNGQTQAAQATPENLARAIADIGETGKMSGYFGERFGHIARKKMAEVWLSNAKIGMLLC